MTRRGGSPHLVARGSPHLLARGSPHLVARGSPHLVARAAASVFIVAAVVAGLAGCQPTITGLEADVTFDPGLDVDQLVFTLSAPGAAAVDPVKAPADPTLLTSGHESAGFIVPDDMADKDVTVAVDANSNGVTVARGAGDKKAARGQIEKLTIALVQIAGCGDGVIDAPETCDDDNTAPNDGCGSDCKVEVGWDCAGEPSVCQRCGDGVQQGTEDCDDANFTDGDGCSSCALDDGYACDNTATPSACAPICGDSRLIGGETCDDGNGDAGDGCSAACAPETGWACDGLAPTTCLPICGDGRVLGGEACDDGNPSAGDGCSSACAVEAGFDCATDTSAPAPQSVCGPHCGDGLLKRGEQCDDHNVADDDGCSSSCAPEAGWNCNGQDETVCTPICGDGIVVSAEGCDDGNLVPGDGCSDACTVEQGFTCDDAGGTRASACDPICGDALVRGNEECDDGLDALTGNSDTRANACRTDCTNPRCGDGVADDGFNEECDDNDANTDNRDACLTGCKLPHCGDGFIDAVAGEQCDDGNATDLDGCSATCGVETNFRCGGEPSTCALTAASHTVNKAGGADFTTIAAGIAGTLPGQTLFIAFSATPYAENLADVTTSMTIVADPGTVLASSSNAAETLHVKSGAAVTVRGLTLKNTGNNRSAVVVENAGTNVTLEECTLGPSPKNGLEAKTGTTVTVRRTRVEGNAEGGMNVDGSYTVENSVIRNNGAAGSPIGGCDFALAGTFRFNTVTGNQSNATAGVKCAAANTALSSSIIFGDTGGAEVSAQCAATTSDTAQDPSFAGDGFHVLAGSPVIDQASTTGCPALDFDGDPRPINTACDLGADERP